MRTFRNGFCHASLVGGLLLVAVGVARPQAPADVTIGVEAEAFQLDGDWRPQSYGVANPSGGRILFAGEEPTKNPAVTAVRVPGAGRYFLWVRALDFPNDRPGTRRSALQVAGKPAEGAFGDSGKPGWTWEPGGVFDLPAGETLLRLDALDGYARVDAVLLTTRAGWTPTGTLGTPEMPRVAPARLTVPERPGGPFQVAGDATPAGEPVTTLANDRLRIEWAPGTAMGKATVLPRIRVRTPSGWSSPFGDPGSERYIVVIGREPRLRYQGFYASFDDPGTGIESVTVEAGGTKVTTLAPTDDGAIWNGGTPERFIPSSVTKGKDGAVTVVFHPSPQGTLLARWELPAGADNAKVTLTFTPAKAGSYALGYHAPLREQTKNISEVLLPMLYNRKRLPARPTTILQPLAPTPLTLAQTGSGTTARTIALAGDPSTIPFDWPDPLKPAFGLNLTLLDGEVQPSIYGPVPGTDAARRGAGQPVSFPFRLLAVGGDWYAGYKAATHVYGLRDYRQNRGTSLTDAVLNMIDLLKDDKAGGWWDRAKAPYQIEAKNTATHSAPLEALSLYRLTGDPDLWNRRALPALEYLLSRGNPHFSPVPDDAGDYPTGGMSGPIPQYGTSVFGGAWELTDRLTPALQQISMPAPETIRPAGHHGHAQEFGEWLALYQMSGDKTALEKAKAGADRYIAENIALPATVDLGPPPFWLISFTPDWESLLYLYEATGEKRYLDAAVFGARQLMVGIWTQPAPPAGEVTLHPNGTFKGHGQNVFIWWRGPEKYRLGIPRQPGDLKPRREPAWVGSNVGLGFEQPSTYHNGGVGARMIYEAHWAAPFLRLAKYTGDPTFATYARNAVIGRWANYPGYYDSDMTDLPLDPKYPYVGPDLTSFYYHHILPHLAWTVDYLVSDTYLLSKGAITFPSVRQSGYAYFDSRIYGQAPGSIFGESGTWLWLRRGLVTLDNPQINYLTARSRGGRLYAILTNQSPIPQKVRVRFDPKVFGPTLARVTSATLREGTTGKPHPTPLAGGAATVTLPGRGLAVLSLDGLRADVGPVMVTPAATTQPGTAPGYVTLKTSDNKPEVRAAAIQAAPGAWDAYLWSTALPKEAKQVTFRYDTGDGWKEVVDAEYPYELSVPVPAGKTALRFRVSIEAPDGTVTEVPESSIAPLAGAAK